jgi:hypothetical protein
LQIDVRGEIFQKTFVMRDQHPTHTRIACHQQL